MFIASLRSGLYERIPPASRLSVYIHAHSVIIYSVRVVAAGRRDIRLMGSAEIGRALGNVGRARVYQITQRRNFPEPIARLEMGFVWLAEDVEAWIRQHRPHLNQDPEAL